MYKDNKNKSLFWSVLFLILVAPIAGAQGFDENYEAYIGDYNNDGYEDIYIRQKPQVIILHGDIATPIVLPPPTEHFVLQQDPINQDFYIQAVTSIDLSLWQLSSGELVLGDFDIDGIVDLLVKGVSTDINNAFDQVVFSEATGLPVQVTEVDEEFSMFFRDTHGWMLDEDYFDQAYEPVELPSYSYYIVADYAYCFTAYGWIQSCFGGTTVIDGIEYYLNEASLNGLAPYLSDPLFYDAAGDLLESILEAELAISLQSHDSGIIQGCYWYCDAYYSPGYSYAIYDLWIPTTEIVSVFDRENFSLDALSFSEVAGNVFRAPAEALQSDPVEAEQIIENIIGTEVGETVANLLSSPLPWPDLPPELDPLPSPREIPKPLPEPANDPDWFPKKPLKWSILRKVGVVIWAATGSEDGESDELLEWYEIGVEWAFQDLLEEGIEENTIPKVVVGEGEGGGVYDRIPDAAGYYSAMYFDSGVFTSEDWADETNQAIWYMNSGWVYTMMLKQSLFYDIGLYGSRVIRGIFYPCERKLLEGYPSRQQESFGGTGGWSYGECTLETSFLGH